jgi:hypothetical protein
MSLGNLWRTLHPIEARLMGGSGRQPNVAGPRWNQTAPGRWEMEGGTPANMGPSGPLREQGAALFPPTGGGVPPQALPGGMQTGGGGQLSQMPGFPAQPGGGMPPMGFGTMTGGLNPPMGGFSGMTGGGGQRMGGHVSSYGLLPQFGEPEAPRQPNPFGRFLPR